MSKVRWTSEDEEEVSLFKLGDTPDGTGSEMVAGVKIEGRVEEHNTKPLVRVLLEVTCHPDFYNEFCPNNELPDSLCVHAREWFKERVAERGGQMTTISANDPLAKRVGLREATRLIGAGILARKKGGETIN
jgi:hypothetical protein